MSVSFAELMANYEPVIKRFKYLFPEVSPLQDKFPLLFKLTTGTIHGVDHWCRVGIYGLEIARALKRQDWITAGFLKREGALEEAVLYAAFFHDCARRTEGVESSHGRAGEEVWSCFADMKKLTPELREAVSQALLFHVDHPAIDPATNEVTICLCNADRLDRVRLGQKTDPSRMYNDGIWPELAPHNQLLFYEVKVPRVKKDLGI